MNFMKNFINRQQGSTIVLFSLALLGMMAITGLALDGGTLYEKKAALQKAADAAVLSGAEELTYSQGNVQQVVGKILEAHGDQNDLSSLNISMENKVSIVLEKKVPLSFFSIFGIDTGTVKVKSAAALGVLGRATGAAPLGIDDSIQLIYGKTYSLKVDQTLEDTGYFGVLALGGTGANSYYNNLRYGYQGELKVGDIIDTQTGNIAGKTENAVKGLIDACPYPEGDYQDYCSRMILVPVYKPYNNNQNQLKEVQITGFAYFYITSMNNNDKTINGVFLKRAGKGFINQQGSDRGAYAIRLTE